MRKLKPETEIRNLKSELKRLRDAYSSERAARCAQEKRAIDAEADAKNWQRRFDEILQRVPKVDE